MSQQPKIQSQIFLRESSGIKSLLKRAQAMMKELHIKFSNLTLKLKKNLKSIPHGALDLKALLIQSCGF